MTFWLVHDEPGGNQRKVLDILAEYTPPLWLTIDQVPPEVDLYDEWVDLPFEAVAAAAARLARPTVSGNDLVISTIKGFGGDSTEYVKLSMHTDQTLALATRARSRDGLPGQIIVGGLSTLYDRAITKVSGTLPATGVAAAAELISGIAGSALTNLFWDLQRSGIPTIASCWTVPSGKKQIPYVPRGVTNIADRIVDAKEFPYEKWQEIVSGTTN